MPSSSSRPGQSRRFLFTLNNYTDDETTAVEAYIRDSCVYGCYGKEVGANGTPHLQGYLHTKAKIRLSQLKGQGLDRAHFEAARGTGTDNRTYCSKDGSFWELGELPADNGHKRKNRDTLALEFIASADAGQAGLATFRESNPGCALFSGHIMLRNFCESRRPVERPSVTCEWIYGNPGVGKSRMAHARFPNAYIKEPKTKWWSGYLFENEVIIDDYGSKCIDINHLLRWLDRYKCLVETKGGMLALLATSFCITSNFHPRELFKEDDGSEHKQLPALLRRMKVTHMLTFPPAHVEPPTVVVGPTLIE
uniref:Replication-associated protein n=1 Tax=Cressdnaviricota sp. TaxID=2748378 RepID=A0A7G8LJ12_9VIRU|nr:replication protein [Cressdnaviricota sp.]